MYLTVKPISAADVPAENVSRVTKNGLQFTGKIYLFTSRFSAFDSQGNVVAAHADSLPRWWMLESRSHNFRLDVAAPCLVATEGSLLPAGVSFDSRQLGGLRVPIATNYPCNIWFAEDVGYTAPFADQLEMFSAPRSKLKLIEGISRSAMIDPNPLDYTPWDWDQITDPGPPVVTSPVPDPVNTGNSVAGELWSLKKRPSDCAMDSLIEITDATYLGDNFTSTWHPIAVYNAALDPITGIIGAAPYSGTWGTPPVWPHEFRLARTLSQVPVDGGLMISLNVRGAESGGTDNNNPAAYEVDRPGIYFTWIAEKANGQTDLFLIGSLLQPVKRYGQASWHIHIGKELINRYPSSGGTLRQPLLGYWTARREVGLRTTTPTTAFSGIFGLGYPTSAECELPDDGSTGIRGFGRLQGLDNEQ